MIQDKKILRKIYLEKRSNINDRERRSALAADNILASAKIIAADLILLYVSVGSEAETSYLTDMLIQAGKKVAMPKCSENGIMTFHIIGSRKDLQPGKYNIPEPCPKCPIAELTEKTVCIVPGLAFTEEGGRLGYGGGYYDRFTAAFPELFTIGLTFEELIVPELPILPHDLRVNAIATEERMVLCSAE